MREMSRSPFQINPFSDRRPFCQQAESFGPMTKLLLILMIVGWVVGVFNGCGHLIKTHTEKYDNGKVSGEGNYIDGKEEGPFVSYYESGKVKGEGHYVDGKEEGSFVFYYESGKVKGEGRYVGGKEEGSFVSYYESGKIKGEANYVVGEKEGKVIAYYESGKIVDEDIYRDGKCVEDCEGNDP